MTTSHSSPYAAPGTVEVTAPGTWVYWLTIAGPIIVEGRLESYWRIVPFFAGSLVGYYGAEFLSVWLMAWGAGAHKRFRRHLFLVANGLLIVLGALYFMRAYFVGWAAFAQVDCWFRNQVLGFEV